MHLVFTHLDSFPVVKWFVLLTYQVNLILFIIAKPDIDHGVTRWLSMSVRLWDNMWLIKGNLNTCLAEKFSTKAHATSSG